MAIRFYLKSLLDENKITQKELSEKTGVRLPTISAICNNNIKQFPITAMDAICEYLHCVPGDFIDYVNVGIKIDNLDNDEYNKLLLSKPLVGGIYKINTTLLPHISEYYKDDYILCVVVGNSIEFPEVTRSIIVTITPKIKALHLPTHYVFKLFDTDYMAMGETYTSFDNSNLTELVDIVSLHDFVRIQNTVNIQSGIILSNQDLELIREQRKKYFQHINKHHDLFVKKNQ